MPFNSLLLPLLGGYLFVSIFHPTRYRIRRQSGRKVLFESAVAGCLLLGIASLFTLSLEGRFPSIEQAWTTFAPFPFSGAASLSLCMGGVLPFLLNRFWTKEIAIRQAITRQNDHLEALILRSLDTSEYVAVVTESSNVYVGFVTSGRQYAHEREFLKLVPVIEGYQSGETRKTQFTTFYAPIYEALFLDRGTAALDPADVEIVLPVSRISSMSMFDEEVYARLGAVTVR